ncbi:MAG: hypothetical protein JKY54_02695 [Flavobacteriales bacterium]|nr:hypothetical protein [Flavobacteriales bacterium]
MKCFKWAMFLLIALSISCEKEPGYGGKASIKGQLTIEKYDLVGQVEDSYTGMNKRVSIIYGEEDNIADDDMKSSFDGTFEFKHLHPGKYTVYLYSDHLTLSSVVIDSTIQFEIDIVEKEAVIDLGEIIIVKK